MEVNNSGENNTKKKQDTMLIAGVVIAAAVILIAVLVVALVFATSNSSSSSSFGSVNNVKIQKVIQKEWDESTQDEDVPGFVKKINELSDFKVISVEKGDNDFYKVTLSVSSPYINDDLMKYQDENKDNEKSEEEMDSAITNIILNANLKSSEQYVYVIKDANGEYHTQFTEEFVDAMYGYAYLNAKQSLDGEKAFFIEGG